MSRHLPRRSAPFPPRWLEAARVAGLALLLPVAARSQAAPAPAGTAGTDAVLFPAIEVTATGYGTPPLQMPFSTTIVTEDAFSERLPRTLPIALGEMPGLMIQKTSTAQGAPYIRGFTGFRTLLLVDGIRLNNSVFREGPNQYWGTLDPLAIARLEVVKGPSSVTFGSDAIGGTVNAVSLMPPLGGAREGVNGRVLHRYATADDSHVSRLEASGALGERAGARLGFSHKNYHDLRAGRGTGEQPRTGYSETAFDGSLAVALSSRARLTALWQRFVQDDAWRTHSTVFGSTWRGTRPGGDLQRSLDQERQLFAVQLHADSPTGAVQQFRASLSHQTQDEDQYRLRGDRRREDTGFSVGTLGASVQAQSRTTVGRWIYGGEFYRDRVDSYSVRYRADGSLNQVDIQGPVADDASYDLVGGYLENRLPRIGPLELVAGGRYNYAAADARRVRDPLSGAVTGVAADWRSLVGSLRGVVQLDDRGRQNLFAGFSEAFRAPNLSDLTRFDIAEGGQIETPAPGLKPEYFVTTEAGWRTQQDRWSATIAWFHTRIRNQIIRTPTGARVDGLEEVTKRNSGAGFVHGVEFAGSAQIAPGWTLTGVATWMEGELDYFPAAASTRLERAPLSRVMPLTVHGAVRWSPAAGRTWVEAAFSAAARQDRLAPNDKVDTERIPSSGTPGYGVATVRAGWRPTRALTLTATLENVADKDYRIHGSGFNEPGRNLVVSADFRF